MQCSGMRDLRHRRESRHPLPLVPLIISPAGIMTKQFGRSCYAVLDDDVSDLTPADIEGALLALARDAASGHGAEVESVRLTLDAESPRTIAVSAVAVAKAMFFTATLTIRGRIAVDGDFNLRLHDATCTGDGMLANLAAAQLRPRLTELQGRTFSLRTFLPPGLRPADVALSGGAALRVTASFSGDGPQSGGK